VQLFLIRYGLLAAFLAAGVEADAVPILTGVAAHHGYFNSFLGVMAASAGALAGDCVWFYVGRSRSTAIHSSSVYNQVGSRVERLIRRLGIWQIPASHVIYGTRVATMILAGACGLSLGTFFLIDSLGCLCLTSLLFTLGFEFSSNAAVILRSVRRIEISALVMLGILGFIYWLRRKQATSGLEGGSALS
jgi:membrane protein DedA with SNARE-associated domain